GERGRPARRLGAGRPAARIPPVTGVQFLSRILRTGRAPRSSFQQLNHLSYRSIQAYQSGSGDDVVANIELFHLRDVTNGPDISVGETVARMDSQAQRIRQDGRSFKLFQSPFSL